MTFFDATPTVMLEEASSAGDAVERFLRANLATIEGVAFRLRTYPPPLIVTCARGSSDNAATYGKYLFETLLGVPVSSSAMSVSSVYRASVRTAGLCVAISQSGRSPDLLAAVKAQKQTGGHVIALVNDEGSPLAALADTLLLLCAGPERSVAATKSYIVSLAGLAAIAAHWAEDAALISVLSELPVLLRRAFALDWSSAIEDLGHATSLFVLGRGYSFAVAQEAALKLKETCGLHAEAFSAAEVRHGPMAIVNKGFPVLAFATSDEAGISVREVAAEFSSRGAVAKLILPGGGDLPAIKSHPAVEPILMTQTLYRFINYLSLHRGLHPDSPPHLAKVTSTI